MRSSIASPLTDDMGWNLNSFLDLELSKESDSIFRFQGAGDLSDWIDFLRWDDGAVEMMVHICVEIVFISAKMKKHEGEDLYAL